jgi:chemotaxis protein CheD
MTTRIVKMAEMDVARRSSGDPVRFKTTLGSCVGIILSNTRRGIHGLAHIMLPECLRKDSTIGKYADTAIPALLGRMREMGSRKEDLRAYLVGGACMFQMVNMNGQSNIGQRNIQAARRILEELDIPVIFEETGGENGRTVIFDIDSENIDVKTLKHIQGITPPSTSTVDQAAPRTTSRSAAHTEKGSPGKQGKKSGKKDKMERGVKN